MDREVNLQEFAGMNVKSLTLYQNYFSGND